MSGNTIKVLTATLPIAATEAVIAYGRYSSDVTIKKVAETR